MLTAQLPTAPVAVLYQAALPPPVDGVRKPMKPGGYSDSGADIAFNLARVGVPIVTPASAPRPEVALDWVFPDTEAGLQAATERGAEVLWANTVLFAAHPLETVPEAGVRIVGQVPAQVQRFDDKWHTNSLLRAAGCPVPHAMLVGLRDAGGCVTLDALTPDALEAQELACPLVVKPVRGRGSQGVVVVQTFPELREAVRELLAAAEGEGGLPGTKYGERAIVEQFLPGTELTVSVLPPGCYRVADREVVQSEHWCLPAVRRFNHHAGVAPYNGVVAVTRNSVVLTEVENDTPQVRSLLEHCRRAAALLEVPALIRIDARENETGELFLFDLNMKPNLTGPGRPGREDQDSLTSLAARGTGWSYRDLLLNLLRQAWSPRLGASGARTA